MPEKWDNRDVYYYLMPLKENRKIKYGVALFSTVKNFFENRDRLVLVGTFKKIIEASLKKLAKEKHIRILYKALENSPNWVVITDRNGNVTYLNKTVEKLSEYTRNEILGENPRIFKSDYYGKKFYQNLWQTILSGESFECIMLNKSKTGKTFKLQYTIIPVKTAGEIQNFVAIGIDTSREEKLKGEVFRLKFHDSLTGTYNRYGAKFEINKLIEDTDEEHPIVVSLVDIHSFSQINTIFSHNTGDQILIEVSNVLKKAFPKSIIGRIGGDKFIVARSVKREELLDYISRFLPLFKSKKLSDRNIRIGVNVGVSIYPNDADNINKLLINSNLALKIAKSRGRNNIKIFDRKISKKMKSLDAKSKLIMNAYENDWFELFLQPYFNTSDLSLAGFESLLRIRHPEKGLIFPNNFIDVLEKSESLSDVEKKIIKKASNILDDWKSVYHDLKPISINVTAKSFVNDSVIETLKQFSKNYMNIEIIERILVDDKEYTQKVLKELKEYNIKCFLDDFGTGYSSLSYITDIAIDTIKIDISFIRKFLQDRKTHAIVESIINLSKKLGMKTIAEGVETEAQFKELKRLGCDIVQGYLFAKPVERKHAEKWLKYE